MVTKLFRNRLNLFKGRSQRQKYRSGYLSILVAVVGIFLAGGTGLTATQDSFYKAKVIRFIVGFSAGGGFDTNARIIARHMGSHIPGNPTPYSRKHDRSG